MEKFDGKKFEEIKSYMEEHLIHAAQHADDMLEVNNYLKSKNLELQLTKEGDELLPQGFNPYVVYEDEEIKMAGRYEALDIPRSTDNILKEYNNEFIGITQQVMKKVKDEIKHTIQSRKEQSNTKLSNRKAIARKNATRNIRKLQADNRDNENERL